MHRIGRTGRAGKKGKAFTIYEEYDEKNILMIEKVISQKLKTIDFKKISLNSSLKNKKNDEQNNTEIHNSTKKVKPNKIKKILRTKCLLKYLKALIPIRPMVNITWLLSLAHSAKRK